MSRVPVDCQVLDVLAPWGWTQHLKVRRTDGKSGLSWDQLQELKCRFLGYDVCAVEFYPPADSVVDEINMRHLWVVPLQAPMERR